MAASRRSSRKEADSLALRLQTGAEIPDFHATFTTLADTAGVAVDTERICIFVHFSGEVTSHRFMPRDALARVKTSRDGRGLIITMVFDDGITIDLNAGNAAGLFAGQVQRLVPLKRLEENSEQNADVKPTDIVQGDTPSQRISR